MRRFFCVYPCQKSGKKKNYLSVILGRRKNICHILLVMNDVLGNKNNQMLLTKATSASHTCMWVNFNLTHCKMKTITAYLCVVETLLQFLQ